LAGKQHLRLGFDGKPGVRLPAAAKTSMFCKSVTTAVVLKAKMRGIMHVCGRLMWPKPRRQRVDQVGSNFRCVWYLPDSIS